MRTIIASGGFSLVSWGLFIYWFRKDRSRYRNCYFLILALLSLVPVVLNMAGPEVVLNLVVLFMLSILVVPFFLIHNGIVMIRREGKHLSQLLSLFLGILILAGEAVTMAGIVYYTTRDQVRPVMIPRTFPVVAGALFSITVIYVSVSFLIFMVYTLFLQIIPIKKDFDYVIIHGAGLLDGERVSKLLKDRLDKAIEVYRQDPTPPKLIPSGGQGPDEKLPEAEAMKRYLISRGIPEEDIIPENRSTTTLENLKYSREIIDRMEGNRYTALVTSNYHVYRALRYCRDIGMKCTGIGSHVAFYFWPSAMIREYIAVHAEKKHAVLFFAGWVFCSVLLLTVILR